MKKYEAYKNSGIEWIGEIPEGWNCLPMKRGLTINNGKDYKDIQAKEGYPVIGSGGQFAYATEFLHDGEAVLLGRKGTIDKPMYINGRFWTVDTMFYAVPDDNVCCKYMFYQAQTIPFGLYSTNTALPSMTQSDLADNPMCFPPLYEQRTIASYLDHKVGQIDASVSAINTQIEDLKAYRQSVISEAVTKGLNPNAPMKDSGIKWIGEIPEGWESLLLKRVAKISAGSTPSTSESKYWDNPNYTWYTPSDIKEDSIYLDDSDRKVNRCAVDEGAIREFPANSILMVGIGSIGKIGLCRTACSSNQQILAITFKDSQDPVFGAYFLQASRDYIKSKANAALLAIINQTTMGNLEIILPPLSEQQAIASYLDAKTAKIDTTIKSLEAQRDDLNALKQSVISEAVTGKIDVRDWEPNNEQ